MGVGEEEGMVLFSVAVPEEGEEGWRGVLPPPPPPPPAAAAAAATAAASTLTAAAAAVSDNTSLE